ncbi:enoyl-CoA hydratase/isomerase family protein [Microbacterium radiodurans]|uniref:enoyl-CoA hydratase/isomerase family protein n=1 Tax=Microbacterium radiodurans TaxID=661398 RepID=UPI001CC3B29C|nr:enoyl-CoA hydratase/isomerase family protein [Microbacterium radiodurans]
MTDLESNAAASGSAVQVRVDRALGHLTLDRPRAINALDLGMLRILRRTLEAWAVHPGVDAVLLDGSGDRGFCAGGDVRGLREQVIGGRIGDVASFFREEYAVDALIGSYPKPVVVFADGVTMGGGIGLAGHAAVRIVTERSRLAMPEVRIGFTPDVGGSLLLGRAPGRVGEYLALTGGTMDAADAIYAGFADHLVPADRLGDLREALTSRADPQTPTELALLFDETPEPSRLSLARPWIDDAFAGESVDEIEARLRARPEPEAQRTADDLAALPPTALTVTLAAVRAARQLPDLPAALEREYGLVMWFAQTQPDLAEGIRARLVDKDDAPTWSPASRAELAERLVDEAFSFEPRPPLWDRPDPDPDLGRG